MSSAAKKRNKKNNGNQPVRVLIRCSWSGARHPVPSPLPTTGRPVTPSTKLSDVIGSIRDALPRSIFDDSGGGGGGGTVVYLRKSAGREDWDTTTLRDLGVGEEEGGGGGGGGGAGVLLTLNLPGNGGGGNASASAATATATATTAAKPPPTAAVAPSDPQPMDFDDTSSPSPSSSSSSTLSTTCRSPSDAIDLLLSSNFDADTRETVVTLLKIIDNVLSKPGDSRVRTIRLGNPAIYKKVTSRKGALDFLVTVGFGAKPKEVPLFSGSVGGIGGAAEKREEVEFIELTEENEDPAQILDARKLLASKAVHVLGMKASELPKLSPAAATSAAAASQSDRKRTASGGDKKGGGGGAGTSFDPYRAHSYNTQSAAAAASSSRGGGPDPNSVTPGSADGNKSKTEKELDLLKAKRNRLEKKMQKLEDRELVATRPGPQGATVTLPSSEPDTSFSASGGGGGKGDGALLAARMKRMEEERKKREEGGLTTKAMRDLEKMKKERVYSHATVRVSFPDGCVLTAKFLPRERVRDVREAVNGALAATMGDGPLKFDLYVAPPRRLLDDAKRLDEEGLVPAAKVHVSWKVGGGPPAGWEVGAYLRPELFAANTDAAASAEAFPDAQKLVRDDGDFKRKASGAAGNGGNGDNGNGEGGGGGSREEELMRRMMGGSKGLLGKLGGGGNKKGGGGNKDGGKSKPKWFKG